MKAMVTFLSQPVFNFNGSKHGTLAAPGVIVGKCDDKRFWTLCFVNKSRINEHACIGELFWLTAGEDDLTPGTEFFLVGNVQTFVDSNMAEGFIASGVVL